MSAVVAPVQLKRSELELCPIGFGCASLMRTPTRRGRMALLGAALEAGITHFDTARLYGLGMSEQEVGRFAAGRRGEITIATKFGIDPSARAAKIARFQGPARYALNTASGLRKAVKQRDTAFKTSGRRYDAEKAGRSLDLSLQQLGTDYVDIFFVHGPAPDDVVDFEGLVEFFAEAKQAGKIRAWGVSQDNHPDVKLVDSLGAGALLQVRADVFDPSERDPDVVFGVLGAANARIAAALELRPELLGQWRRELDVDLAAPGTLASLLLADSVRGLGARATLYSTTNPGRMRSAVDAITNPPAAEVLDRFRALCEQLERTGA